MYVSDPHYTIDEDTGYIAIDTLYRFYLMEKKAFTLHGVDIATLTHYKDYYYQFHNDINYFFEEYVMQKEAKTLDQKYDRVLLLCDLNEADRLKAIIERMKATNLKVKKKHLLLPYRLT